MNQIEQDPFDATYNLADRQLRRQRIKLIALLTISLLAGIAWAVNQ